MKFLLFVIVTVIYAFIAQKQIFFILIEVIEIIQSLMIKSQKDSES